LNVISDRDFTSDNISKYLREIAEVKGDLAGVIEARTGKRITFAELEKLSDQYAYNLVDYGVKTGDRVMVMVKPSADFICITFALFKIGAPVILIDPGMGYRNLLRCVSRVKPKIFIGIPKAHLFVTFFRKYFDTLTCKLCSGSSFGLFGPNILKLKEVKDVKFPLHAPLKDDLAAIIFTTGSTGPPKGVRYEHTIFAAQLRHIKEYYQITPNDTDQPAFPLVCSFLHGTWCLCHHT
jgi:long-subunit acyl-CoA synthetase (AMP-forming)